VNNKSSKQKQNEFRPKGDKTVRRKEKKVKVKITMRFLAYDLDTRSRDSKRKPTTFPPLRTITPL